MNYVNVLQLTTDSKIGGAEEIVLSLSKGLIKKNFNVYVCCLSGMGPLVNKLQKEEISISSLFMRNKLDISGLYRLVKLLRGHKFHIIHAHLFHANLLARIIGRVMNIPVVITCEHTMGIEGKHRILINRFTSALSDRIIAISFAVRDFVVNEIGIDSSKVVTIRNGIDREKYNGIVFDRYKKKAEFGINKNDNVIGMVGRIDENKGQRYFLMAAKEILNTFEDIKFLIVGDGPLKGEMEILSKKLEIDDNVIFTGFRNDAPELLNIMDIFALSSLWEGLPITILEAMLLKKPVVVTNVSGNPEVVENNKTGILVPPKDYKALAAAITHLIQDETLAKKMGELGYKRVVENFTAEKMVEETIDLYNKLLYKKSEKEHRTIKTTSG